MKVLVFGSSGSGKMYFPKILCEQKHPVIDASKSLDEIYNNISTE